MQLKILSRRVMSSPLIPYPIRVIFNLYHRAVSIAIGLSQFQSLRFTLMDKIGGWNPAEDSSGFSCMRVWGMRTGISFTVSTADRVRLDAIVAGLAGC